MAVPVATDPSAEAALSTMQVLVTPHLYVCATTLSLNFISMISHNTPQTKLMRPLLWLRTIVSWSVCSALFVGALPLVALSSLVCAQNDAGSASPVSKVMEYELRVAAESFAPAGKSVVALTINGGIPGPTLSFTEGDTARITVRNTLVDQETSIHWHGLLVPNVMDGVPYLTTPPIEAGGFRIFEFVLRQSGTYWYHSHTGLQEQRGVYGSIVVQPRIPDVDVDREHVVVLSDWTNEDPQEVMRTLMRGSEWYGQRKGTSQSLLGAWNRGALGEFFSRERSRMPPMDVSDVAYDAFLANGEQRHGLHAEPGERVLLRVINAGASSYFHLTSATGPMTIVGSDGMRVRPVEVNRLLIGMAETYDVIITMPTEPAAVEFRATAQDVSGYASVILGHGELLEASNPARPNLYTMNESVVAGIESVHPERGADAATAPRPFAPYALLESVEPTALVLDAGDEKRVREITLRLTGDMNRYRWGFDGKTLAEDAVIPISAGEILRIELVNDTMMHHPLHLHGHFFRLLNGKGEHAPLKHTVDVPPMGKRVIEWVADEEAKDWFFHCHLLYHMDAGMARVFSYRGQAPDHRPSIDPKLLNPTFAFVDAVVQSHMTMGRAVVMQGRNDYLVRWDAGIDAEEHEDREIDVAWSRYVDQNLSSILGYRFTNVHGASDRLFGGVRYRLPYLVKSELTLDERGDLRISLEKEYMLSNRLAAFASGEYDTNTYTEWEAGLGWTLSKRFGLVASYHSEHRAGFGLSFSF
ncbi:MAG: FtsP/CotA-like multicopper oxidase with cupredoxin domain [Planctomycetota bacterium]